jgi:Dimerisation domain
LFVNGVGHSFLNKEAIMVEASAQVIDLIFGRWRSQILYAGVKLGIFDALAHGPKNAVSVASELGADSGMLYRLMRALASLELLTEDHTGSFFLTLLGELLTKRHPHTLRGMALWEEGPFPTPPGSTSLP